MDSDGYPEESDLEKIRFFHGTAHEFIDLIRSMWWAEDYCFKCKGKSVLYLQLHTGGWSGNETIIAELKTTFFWFCFWEKSLRGGHYYFRVPLKQLGNFKKLGKV